MWIEKDCGFSSPCHIWTGGKSREYGYDSSARRYAHRAAWERLHGPAGRMHVHHLCGEKMCVNVEHLELRSPQEHRQLHQATNRRRNKLSAEAIEDIRESPEALKIVASRYEISIPYAAKVRRGLAPVGHELATPKPAWDRGRPTPPKNTTRLSPEDIDFIRNSDASLRMLGEIFSLSPQYISMIKNRHVLND